MEITPYTYSVQHACFSILDLYVSDVTLTLEHVECLPMSCINLY